jgi:hypothetical protein
MSNEKLSNVNAMVTYTNSFFNSIKKTSHNSVVILLELGLIAAIIAMMSAHNTVAVGIMLVAGVGVAMNLFTIESYNRDYDEFQELCMSFTNRSALSITETDVTSHIENLRKASEGYINKYKLISVVNSLTLAVVAILVCLVVTAII